ncbi:MAG TPA: riboflavin biosynthesis protein RibF [Tepidisphaeraceae bacterium]|jgi:riboflavin kinase/FMN adenylyltransferase|nr:riboflavin biosynthesis protein RibF [Tepidisphaeraceae bacterium]
MQIVQGIDGLLKIPKRSVISIGNFDGIHLGHRRILETAHELAVAKGSPLALVTFEPHPLTVLRPGAAPPRLTPPAIKQPLLEAAGADWLVVLPPEKQVLHLTAEDFWMILRDRVGAADLVEGASFRFGKAAQGTIAKLRDWCAKSQVLLHVVESVQVPLLDLQITPVSSSVIRFLLAYGRVRDASICLGRPYALSGVVCKGLSRGKSLGFPTANLRCDDQLIPADAVYAGRCTVEGKTYPAAVSIGTMPTFGENARQIEAHLIGFEGDLYGVTLAVELLNWLREQRAYNGIEPLKAQIHEDIADTVAAAAEDLTRPIVAMA